MSFFIGGVFQVAGSENVLENFPSVDSVPAKLDGDFRLPQERDGQLIMDHEVHSHLCCPWSIYLALMNISSGDCCTVAGSSH